MVKDVLKLKTGGEAVLQEYQEQKPLQMPQEDKWLTFCGSHDWYTWVFNF